MKPHRHLLAYMVVLFLALLAPPIALGGWVVEAPKPGAEKAPTFYRIPGRPSETWPLDYSLEPVGAPCDCSTGNQIVDEPQLQPSTPVAITPAVTWCALQGRRTLYVRCRQVTQ